MSTQGRSAFAHVLFLSGFLGIAVGMSIAVYQALLRDPIFLGGQQVVPSWVSFVFFAFISGSLAVLLYASVLDRLFRGWFDIMTGAALLGQWGFPVGLYLSETGGMSNLINPLTILFSALNVLVALAVLGNYLRREWPAFSD